MMGTQVWPRVTICRRPPRRFHRLTKLVLFRLVNTKSLFIVRYFSDVPFYPCMTSRVGNQMFIMIMFEITLGNFAELGWALVVKCAAPPSPSAPSCPA